MKKQVRSIVRKELKKDVEVKYVELHANEVPINVLGAATVANLSQVGQGSGPYERVGKKVRNIGIHIRGVLNNNSTVTQFCRMAVVQSKDQADINPATLIMASTGTGPATGATATDQSGGYTAGSVLSGLDTIYYKLSDAKVNVLSQWTMKLGSSNTLDGSNASIFNKFLKSKRTLEYSGTGNATCIKPIYLVIWAADASDDALSGNLELNYLATIYYTDM